MSNMAIGKARCSDVTMLEVVVAYQYVTVFVCCRLAQQLVRPQGPWVQALPQVHEWDR